MEMMNKMKANKLKIGHKYGIRMVDHEMPDEYWYIEEALILTKSKKEFSFFILDDFDGTKKEIKNIMKTKPVNEIETVRIDGNEYRTDMGDTVKIKKYIGKF